VSKGEPGVDDGDVDVHREGGRVEVGLYPVDSGWSGLLSYRDHPVRLHPGNRGGSGEPGDGRRWKLDHEPAQGVGINVDQTAAVSPGQSVGLIDHGTIGRLQNDDEAFRRRCRCDGHTSHEQTSQHQQDQRRPTHPSPIAVIDQPISPQSWLVGRTLAARVGSAGTAILSTPTRPDLGGLLGAW